MNLESSSFPQSRGGMESPSSSPEPTSDRQATMFHVRPQSTQSGTAMHPLFEQALGQLDSAFASLTRYVKPPRRVPIAKGGYVYRYAEKTIEQALIQKLARVISGL